MQCQRLALDLQPDMYRTNTTCWIVLLVSSKRWQFIQYSTVQYSIGFGSDVRAFFIPAVRYNLHKAWALGRTAPCQRPNSWTLLG